MPIKIWDLYWNFILYNIENKKFNKEIWTKNEIKSIYDCKWKFFKNVDNGENFTKTSLNKIKNINNSNFKYNTKII